jgi:hypothetical protein
MTLIVIIIHLHIFDNDYQYQVAINSDMMYEKNNVTKKMNSQLKRDLQRRVLTKKYGRIINKFRKYLPVETRKNIKTTK